MTDTRRRTWIWSAAALSLITGILLVLNDSGAGWFFLLLGIVYLGTLTRSGQAWTGSHPSLERWGFIGVAGLLVLLVVVAGAVFLLR